MRRAISIIFYAIGGFFLLAEAVVAFAGDQVINSDGAAMKLAIVGFMALFPLVFLLIGVAVSPGSRLRELGLVLLISAGWAAFTIISMAYVMLMPDTRHLFPDEIRETFSGYWFGIANLAAISAMGWWMFKRGSARRRVEEHEV